MEKDTSKYKRILLIVVYSYDLIVFRLLALNISKYRDRFVFIKEFVVNSL